MLYEVITALLFAQFITVTGGLGDLLEEERLQRGEIDKIYQVDYKDSEMANRITSYNVCYTKLLRTRGAAATTCGCDSICCSRVPSAGKLV